MTMHILDITPEPQARPSREQVDMIRDFCAMVAEDEDFDAQTIFTRTEVPHCGLWLRPDFTDLPCLAICRDVLGNWTVLLPGGGHRQYLEHEIA